MSNNLKYNFCLVVEEIFELGNATKYRCLGVHVQAQANGKEPWINKRPTSDRRCSDWQRTLSDDQALTDHISRVVVKGNNSSEERIISFERSMTNHDKLPRENNASNYIARNLHKRSSCVFLKITSASLLSHFVKKESSYIFLLNQGRSIFKKELIYKRRCGSLFCYLLFLASLVLFASRNMIFFSSQKQFFQTNWRLLRLHI